MHRYDQHQCLGAPLQAGLNQVIPLQSKVSVYYGSFRVVRPAAGAARDSIGAAKYPADRLSVRSQHFSRKILFAIPRKTHQDWIISVFRTIGTSPCDTQRPLGSGPESSWSLGA